MHIKEKWGKHLKQSDLNYFDPLKDDYEIAYHLKSLRKAVPKAKAQKLDEMDTNLSNKIIRNRRYNYVQRHPEYFTLENLQERNPYEYEEYIGQYIPEDKRVEFQPFQNNMSLVERMYFDIDHQRMNDEIEKMEDILYQEEEKEKAEDKRENELIKKKEQQSETEKINNTKKENDNNKNNETKEKKEEQNQTNNSLEQDEKADIPIVPLPSKDEINEDDILKLSSKNQKFYQMMNAIADDDDFVEEEDDSDEEYNEETIMKEIERRRELKKQEQMLKEKQEPSINISKSDTKGKRTKIKIINPAYYDNKDKNNTSNNKNKNDEKTPNENPLSLNQTKPTIQSVEDIFNVKEDDERDNDIREGENQNEDEEDEDISEELKQYYYNEFINIMKKEFIDGHDVSLN